MNRWIKYFSVFVAVLVALVIALIVLANVLITPERVKETLLPLAEENLQRKIEMGEIEASLFSGIEIHGLTVYEQDGSEVFISTDLVRLKYQLLPLLAMKVVVDEVRLEKPMIRVVRFKDELFNFSDLVTSSENETDHAGGAVNQSSSKTQGRAPISLLISNILLQDGQLTFLDHVLNDKAPYRYEISSLQMEAKGVSLAGKVPLSLQCQLNGSHLALDGHVSLLPLSGNFEVALQNLDIVAFSPYIQNVLPGKLGGVKLNLKSNLSGTLDEISLKGTLLLSQLDLLLDALPDAPLKNARLETNYNVLFARGQERLQLRQLDLDYNGIKVNTIGEVTGLMSAPVLDLSVTVPGMKIRQAVDAFPKGLVGDVSSLDPAGSLSINANFFGRVADASGLLKSAIIDLDNVQATAGGQRPAFTGRLLVSGDQLSSEDLQIRLGDNIADINLKAEKIYSKPIALKTNLSSKRFLLEPLLQGSAGSAMAVEQNSGKTESNNKNNNKNSPLSDEVGPFDIPLHATGAITVAETVWKGLVIKEFQTLYELKNNVLNLTRIDGQVAGGSFSNSARVDLGKKGLIYSAKLGLKSVQSDPLLTAFVPKAAGSLLGAMDLSFALDGRGTKWETLRRKLSGSGNMLIADGRLVSPGLVSGLSAFLQLPELNDIQFDNFVGQFKVVDGKVNLDSKLISNTLKFFPEGTVGLDGSLKLGLDTRLSPELSARLDQKGGVSRYLEDNDGWTRIPILLTGNFTSPSFGLDPKGLREQANKAVSKELGRQINKLFKGQKTSEETDIPQTGEERPSTEDPTQKLLQDSLQKLFGN